MNYKSLAFSIQNKLNGKKFQLIIKRIFDIVFSMILFIILIPLFLIISILIKINSRGEVIFKQKRVGKNNKIFIIYKFRTMFKNADKMFNKEINRNNLETLKFQEENDPRVTRVGKFLRKTSLDELPQLINIIKGEMSLIGPRPEVVEIASIYNDYEKIRLMVKPGVTGLAQVNGRGDLELKETINYDIKYIKEFSLLLDIKIFMKTFEVVLKGKGAY